MRKMLDELKKIDNEESIKIPEGFRNRVINEINADNKSNIFKYIIPACSVAVIVFCIVIASNTINKDNTLVDNKMFASNKTEELARGEVNIEEAVFDDANTIAEDRAEVAATNSMEMAAINEKKELVNSKEYEDEIIDMLKINKVDAQKTDKGIRAKGKKEDIEVILFYFIEQINITQDGEYVIIKEK